MLSDEIGTAERFAIILDEFSKNEFVSSKRLVTLTGASIRTIQRDLNERLKTLFLIEKVIDRRGFYTMNKSYRDLFTFTELKNIASLAGINELFPEFSEKFIKDLLNQKVNNTFVIKSPYKDITHDKKDEFKIISDAIDSSRLLRFTYNKNRYTVEPYQLLNTNGHWYLCCVHEGKLKTFRLSLMIKIAIGGGNFNHDHSVLDEINRSESIWMGNKMPINIKVKVSPDFSEYFKERIILPGQQNIIENEDGSLLVDVEATFVDEIQGIIKYWIPRLQVIEPEYLKESIKKELSDYIRI